MPNCSKNSKILELYLTLTMQKGFPVAYSTLDRYTVKKYPISGILFKNNSEYRSGIREAAKKVLFLMAVSLRGRGKDVCH